MEKLYKNFKDFSVNEDFYQERSERKITEEEILEELNKVSIEEDERFNVGTKLDIGFTSPNIPKVEANEIIEEVISLMEEKFNLHYKVDYVSSTGFVLVI
jgi:hypothetical protein